MRGKKAKQLRKLAREATVGKPEYRLLALNRTVTRENKKGDSVNVSRQQAITDPASTHGLYRRLKRMYKKHGGVYVEQIT